MIQRIIQLGLPILIFFILLFAYTKLFGPIPFSVNSVTTTKLDSFYVTGEGRSFAVPDLAVLNIGVSANGVSVKSVQDQMNTSINKVSEEIKKLGVAKEDIQTTNYNINPNYDFREGGQRITGFSASTNLTIRVKDFEKINQILDTSTTVGANQVGGINFEISDLTKGENEAREKAVKKAKEKAEAAAKAGGFTLGKLINYKESLGEPPVILRAAQGAEDTAEIQTQIEPGTSEIIVTVTLSYEIR